MAHTVKFLTYNRNDSYVASKKSVISADLVYVGQGHHLQTS